LFSKFTVHIQSLGVWVSDQRSRRKKHDAGNPCGGMNDDRIKLLEDIGFKWVVNVTVGVRVTVGWDGMYDVLKEFKKLNGHTNVSTLDPDNKVSVLLL
jgi:Helicase associated domain